MADKLTLSYTEDELKKIAQKRKNDSELPKTYSKETSSSTPISRDTEAFLILEDFGFKDTMVDKIKAVLADEADDLETELFEEAMENEKSDVSEVLAECSATVGTINEIKVKLQETKFSGLSDLSRMLTDVIDSSNRTELKSRLAQYRIVYLDQLKSAFAPSARDEETDKQTKSDLNPLTAY